MNTLEIVKALWKVGKDRNVLLISVSVFLSYLPEAGQYSCFFVYLRLFSLSGQCPDNNLSLEGHQMNSNNMHLAHFQICPNR
ncbi:Hippocampus abundant transcript-like protein 1 [Portunus trituberculatus]|uniref:Hippocampus abundant transcript-like protein 1 n=1 Tax=Portunus trituberculatus TaxID=210409 RepID=A0A5B7CUG4_PORTR|nr:Hippocampus abundant transcript-like protein 1 [Portunus trituberculatus]